MLKAPVFVVTLAALPALTVDVPAIAYYGPCYTDNFGRCVHAPTSMMTLKGDPRDKAAFGTTPDQAFAYFVTHDDDTPDFIITNFDLLKSQALRGCELQRSGWSTWDTTTALANEVGYSREVAANIIISGTVVYCGEVNQPNIP